MRYQVVLLFILSLLLVPGSVIDASREDELRSKITETASEVQKLEKEIKEYEGKVQETKKEATTLNTAIKELQYTEQKLETDIVVTGKRIENTELNIERLDIEIGDTGTKIDRNKEAIRETLLRLQEAESTSLVEVLFIHDTVSDFWGAVNDLQTIQKSMTVQLGELQRNKLALETASKEAAEYRGELIDLRGEYIDKKEVTEITKEEKAFLLNQTKNRQSEFERLLEDRVAKKEAFEEELTAYEQELRDVLDRSLLPTPRAGVLEWPLKSFIITQYYGNTPFATANPSVYSGRGHNGIDLAVGIGTTVYSARQGKVLGVGNTDATCPNASYGKWILIEHDNGLTTLYAHLSLIRVSSGETVTSDQIIGYTGNSGYSTGPHLHFTVFASDSVKIGSLNSRSCANVTYSIPLLTKTGGYLNPLSYLPEP